MLFYPGLSTTKQWKPQWAWNAQSIHSGRSGDRWVSAFPKPGAKNTGLESILQTKQRSV